ncbi:hypothetical protein CTAYLR_006227 [Chrysophaeum taylorii]|uniref:PDZ domain-containing protein n=1 Tax=Chrysophaeum taylorii TaxID=2483200 RepID=A0AAD7XH82_9STRA|nr:hypothetical protein CTAYLR_006227 [Chrysophaeum taylorii]
MFLLSFLAATARPPRSVTQYALEDVARRLKLEVYDLDEGIFGFNSQDATYGIEVVRATIRSQPSLGLELTEVAAGVDGRGLVLVSGVTGNAATEGSLRVGDTLTVVLGSSRVERTTALDYDNTVAAIQRAVAGSETLTIEANRLVERAKVKVEFEGPGGRGQIDALAGENLRKLLMRAGAKVYDPRTRRFDQPFATGDCAGEGICGTCLISVQAGADSLSPKDPTETLITKGRPGSWRAACRCVVGADNTPASLRVKLTPQSQFADEIAPRVKPISP